jgi:hypothetical protein
MLIPVEWIVFIHRIVINMLIPVNWIVFIHRIVINMLIPVNWMVLYIWGPCWYSMTAAFWPPHLQASLSILLQRKSLRYWYYGSGTKGIIHIAGGASGLIYYITWQSQNCLISCLVSVFWRSFSCLFPVVWLFFPVLWLSYVVYNIYSGRHPAYQLAEAVSGPADSCHGAAQPHRGQTALQPVTEDSNQIKSTQILLKSNTIKCCSKLNKKIEETSNALGKIRLS